jgi:hypothetical protein
MITNEYKDFMLAVVGASASFIGLLFVALSVVIPNLDLKVANRERGLAVTAYGAFLNVFFLSLVALLPSHNIVAIVALLFGISGLMNSLSYLKMIFSKLKKRGTSSFILIIPLMSIIYVVEVYFGVRTLQNGAANMDVMVGLLIALFTTGLARAWELLGIEEHPARRHKNRSEDSN